MTLDQVHRAQQLLEPLKGVVLALDGDEHLGRRHQRVHGEQPQRRRAVDDDVVQAGRVIGGDRPRQPRFPGYQRNEFDLRAGQVDGRGRAQQPRQTLHRPDDLGQRLVLDQHVVHRRGADTVIHVERGGGVPLRVEVDHQHLGSVQSQGGREVDRGGGLAHSALLVGDRHDPARPGPRPGSPAAAADLDRDLGGAGNGRIGGQAVSLGPGWPGGRAGRVGRHSARRTGPAGRGLPWTGRVPPAIEVRPRSFRLAVACRGLIPAGGAQVIGRDGFT